MTDNKIIHNLIEGELAEANKQHPLFADAHHAYAVIKEEVEELHEELVACEGLLGDMWHNRKPFRWPPWHRKHWIQSCISGIMLAKLLCDNMRKEKMTMTDIKELLRGKVCICREDTGDGENCFKGNPEDIPESMLGGTILSISPMKANLLYIEIK